MKLFFDTETTGLPNFKNPEKDTPRLVQLGAILTENDGTIRRTLGVIFRSENYTISKEASDIHGITDEVSASYGMARSPEFFWMLSDMFHNADEIVAHNYSFDKIIINGEFLLAGMGRLDDTKSFCTMLKSTNGCAIPGRFKGKYKWPKLSEAYKILCNKELVGAHDALTDVRATMELYFALKKLDDLSKVPIILSDKFKAQFQSTL